MVDFKRLNYYQILDVPYNASGTEIKKAYRRLLKKYHPDVYKTNDANKITSLINEAYLTLSNREFRVKYNSEIFPHFGVEFDIESMFKDVDDDGWYEKGSGSVFNDIYGFNENGKSKYSEYEFNSADYQTTKSFTSQLHDDLDFEEPHAHHKKWNDYSDNAFDIKVDKNIISRYCRAFEIEWDKVLEILCEANLILKEIYLRCYYNQHYFQNYKLSGKQLLAENVHKSVLVHSDQYKKFIATFHDEQTKLNLVANFYFDEILLQNDFEKIFRYYRLYTCKFCQTSNEKSRFAYCHFCFNKGFLKERMAVAIG